MSHEIFLPLIDILKMGCRFPDGLWILCATIRALMSGHVITGPDSGDGYKDVYTNKLESIQGGDIHLRYGTKESVVAKRIVIFDC